MILSRILLSVLVYIGGTTTAGAGSTNIFYTAQEFTLRNGMRFIVIPNHRAPVVVHAIVYNVGAADDPLTKGGAAHLLEHLMFRGSTRFPDQEFKQIVSREGAAYNAYTDWDHTCYYEITHPKGLEKMMELEADRMQNLVIKPEHVASEVRIVEEEYQNRIGDYPQGQLQQAVAAAFFWHHPYRRLPAGWLHEIRKLTYEDAMRIYNTCYVPNNAVCLIIGDVSFEQAKVLAERHYGPIPARKLSDRQWAEEPEHFGETTRVVMRHERLHRAEVAFFYPAPNTRTDVQHVLPLMLLVRIFGDEGHGLVHQALVTHQKLAAQVSAHYMQARGPLWFELSVIPREITDLDITESALAVELRRLVNIGISEASLAQAKKQVIFEYHQVQDDLRQILSVAINQLIIQGRPLEDLKHQDAQINAITVEQVNQTLRHLFNQAPRVISVTYPVKKQQISDVSGARPINKGDKE